MSQLDKIYMEVGGTRNIKHTKLGASNSCNIRNDFLDLIRFPMKVLFMGFSTDFGRGL